VIGRIKIWWHAWREAVRCRTLIRQTTAPDANQRQQAAVALAGFRDERSAVALVALLKDSHTAVREAASASIRAFGPVALGALLEGMKDPNADVATASVALVGELENPAAVEPLIVALKYSPRPVQLAAKRALVRLGAPAADAVRAAAEDPQPWVRQQFADVLEQIAADKGATT
jgi:HEAT repeat protein